MTRRGAPWLRVGGRLARRTVGTIGGMKRNHGVALAPEFNRGFITDGDGAQIVVFDLKTLKQTGTIPAERGADSIFYDPASKRVFVFQGSGKNTTVIDAEKETEP